MLIRTTVNGVERAVEATPETSLLTLLRDELGLAGSKNACEEGECGSCSVWLDGELVCSCLVPAVQADGREVRTVEALADRRDASPACRRRSSTRAPSSAASARRAPSSPRRTCSSATPHRTTTRSARRSRATSAAAPATRRSSTPCTSPPDRRAIPTRPSTGGVGESARRVDGVPKVTGEFEYGSDLRADGMLPGAQRCGARTPLPASARSTRRRPRLSPGVARRPDGGRRPGEADVRPRVRRPAGARRRTSSATRASRSRSSRPRRSSRLAARPSSSRSSTSCCRP